MLAISEKIEQDTLSTVGSIYHHPSPTHSLAHSHNLTHSRTRSLTLTCNGHNLPTAQLEVFNDVADVLESMNVFVLSQRGMTDE